MAKLVGTATQGSADAFKSASIATALSGQTSRAYKVNQVIFELATMTGGSSHQIEVALARRDKTSMPNVTDQDVMFKYRSLRVFTTSGAANVERTLVWTPPIELLIVEDPIYLILDSDSTGAAQTVYMSMDYELVSISETDRLTLLVQSLV